MTSLITTRIGMYLPPPSRERITSRKNASKPLRLFLFTFLSLLLLFSPLGGIFEFVKDVSAQQADPTGYPYIGHSRTEVDAWNFYKRECVSYAAWRVNKARGSINTGAGITNFLENTMFGDGAGRFSHGHHWDDAVTYGRNPANGYNTEFYFDNIPVAGAVAVWDENSTTGGRNGIGVHGHVAYVESVNADGTVNVSEYNADGNGNYGTAANTRADHYIHFNAVAYPKVNLSGFVYTSTNPVLFSHTAFISAIVTSPGQYKDSFYYRRSYYGVYNIELPPGTTVTLTASNGSSRTTIKNLQVPSSGNKAYNLTLNNTCIDASNGFPTACDTNPVVAGANYGPMMLGSDIYSSTACTSPPNTNSSISGATQGNNGWWRSAVHVSLDATAPCGFEDLKTYYSINGGAQQQYSGQFTINQEGIHNISYYSVDKLGNTESSKSTQVKIDWTPPVTTGSATGPRDTNGIFRDDVTAGLASTDNLSGVENQQRSVDGGTNWITQNGNNNTFQITGNGVSRFIFRASDVAGNVENQKDSGPIIINKYVIFSNGTSNSLRFLRSSGVNITGDIYSGGTVTIDANTSSILGTTMKSVGTSNVITNSNTGVQVPTITTGVPSVPMLSYPLAMYKSLATVVFPSDLYMNSVSSQLKGIIYVEGNVEMLDVGLSGPVSIVATGTINDITTDSSFQTGDPNNGVLLYAGQNINVNSTGNRNLGLMYAPTGIISIQATGLTLKGSLVANQVELNGATNFNLSYNAAFASTTHPLPLTAMGLAANTTPLPAMPSVPVLSSPSNGGGATASKARLLWKTSTGAVGYQLQVAKDTGFTNMVHNGSYLYNGATVRNLQRGTRYYWRVRSINQAGMSAWSTTWNFLGQ
jgi:surface antigen